MVKIVKIFFNKTDCDENHLRQYLSTISIPSAIIANGGFLFKSRQAEDAFYFGVLPSFTDGERNYHYNIDVGEGKSLIGFINPDMSLTIVFKLSPEEYRKGLSEELKEEYCNQFFALGDFLLNYGFPENFKIDNITSDMLKKTGIYSHNINTIKDLLNIKQDLKSD